MNSDIQKLYDQEISRIRANPRLVGDWGSLQEYIHNLGESHCVHYEHLDDGRICEIMTGVVDNKICLTISVPKKEYQRPPPSRYQAHELDKETIPLPADLQEIINATP